MELQNYPAVTFLKLITILAIKTKIPVITSSYSILYTPNLHPVDNKLLVVSIAYDSM